MQTFLTTSTGSPVDNDNSSQTVGPKGPILIQDIHLIDKLAHFDRERIPERVVHAKGAAAHGYFTVTSPIITQYCKAKLFDQVGKRTPIFLRFSTVGGEKGSGDTERDPRGFAIKFYTEEGNWDMVGNNTPVFFIRDPSKFPDFIHTQKRNPQTNLKDPDAYWDFLSLVPESLHQVTILFSDRGTPDGYRFMNGYGSHTYRLINSRGQAHYAKFHFKTDQKIKNLFTEKAVELVGTDPDYATRDLFNAIDKKEFPSWTFYIQVMPEADAIKYRWNIFDVTKVWPHGDYPLVPIGKFVLNRNPDNYFAETEQSAFSPSHTIPGIEASWDKMLQGRLFSYPDTHRHRLGPNYSQIPINSPKCPVNNYQRDGFMTVNGNHGPLPNYYPNSQNGPTLMIGSSNGNLNGGGIGQTPSSQQVSGMLGKWDIPLTNEDFIQPANLFKLQSKEAQQRLVNNMINHMKNTKPHIRRREIANIMKADKQWGQSVEQGIAKVVGSRI